MKTEKEKEVDKLLFKKSKEETEKEKEVNKLLFKKSKEETEDLLNSVSFLSDELMRHFDREKVVDIKCDDLQKKIDRFYGRLKRK